MKQAVLFSAVEGQVVRGGQPVAGATLVRQWEFAEQKVVGRDETQTDATGRFHFDAVIHTYQPSRFFAQQTFIEQQIHVSAGGQEWAAWIGSKFDLDAGTEVSRRPVKPTDATVPLRVIIDLDASEALRGRVLGHTFFQAEQ